MDASALTLTSLLGGSDGLQDVLVAAEGPAWPVRAVVADGTPRAATWEGGRLGAGDRRAPDGLVPLRARVLDRQIVDVAGRRVVRVGDVDLAEVDGVLCAVALEVGVAPVLRRLGLGVLARGDADLLRLAHVTVDEACLVAHVPVERIGELETHHLARLIRRLPHRMSGHVLAGLPAHREREVHAHITAHPHRPRLRRYRPSRHA